MAFWAVILVVVVLLVGAAVLVGLNLRDSRKHDATSEEMLALKTSGAFKHRKSNLDGNSE